MKGTEISRFAPVWRVNGDESLEIADTGRPDLCKLSGCVLDANNRLVLVDEFEKYVKMVHCSGRRARIVFEGLRSDSARLQRPSPRAGSLVGG